MKYLVKNLPVEQYVEAVIKHPDSSITYNCKNAGELKIHSPILPVKELRLTEKFAGNCFKLKRDKKNKLIEDIKVNVNKLMASDDLFNFNLSYFLSEELGYNYTYLTNVFSEEEGISIKKYVILQKIERIKAMILSDRFSLKQISSLMKYKNVSHFTNQFKKMTGMAPSGFRKRINVK